MKTVYQIVALFYSTFGITPPKPGEEARAFVLLLVILFGCALFILAAIVLIAHLF